MTAVPEQINTTSTLNSTTSPLSGGATFTGTGEQNDLAQVGVMIKTDAAGTLYFDFSSDGTNWDSTFPVGGFDIAANIPDFHTAVKLGRYFRCRLVNGAGAQSFLRLTCYFGDNFIPSIQPLNQAYGLDTDCSIVRTPSLLDGCRSGANYGHNLH